VSIYLIHSVGGQTCIPNPDIQQIAHDQMTRNRVGIVPHLKFHCNARITRIIVRLLPDDYRDDHPYIQIWRPSSKNSNIYTKVTQVKVSTSQIHRIKYVEADIILYGSDRIPIESGDVIGYYHPPDAGYKVRTIRTGGYSLYVFKYIDGSTATTLDITKHDYILHQSQPLMQFYLGK